MRLRRPELETRSVLKENSLGGNPNLIDGIVQLSEPNALLAYNRNRSNLSDSAHLTISQTEIAFPVALDVRSLSSVVRNPRSAMGNDPIARVHRQFCDSSLRRHIELNKGRSLFGVQRVLPLRPKRVAMPV